MNDVMKIGIVGLGFVGSAIQTAYNDTLHATLVLVDPYKGFKGTYDDLKDTRAVFVCVPSPQGDDGSCDTSILEDVLDNLKRINYHGTIISKVTAPPNVYSRLQESHKNLVHAPEFLTAANAVNDYLNGQFAIIGGEVPAYMHDAEKIIRLGQPNLRVVNHCTIAEASLTKYAINCFLSTKVIFMNELHNLSKKLNCDYDEVAYMVNLDQRIGRSHMKVPGPDGLFGFGGACFPKDTSAMLKFAADDGISLEVLNAAVKKNTLLRLTEPK